MSVIDGALIEKCFPTELLKAANELAIWLTRSRSV